MSNVPVSIGDSVTTDSPVRGLQDEEEMHFEAPLKLFYPSALKPCSEIHQLCGVATGDIWVEVGASAYSIAPYSNGHVFYLVFDRRPWVQRLIERSHSPRVRETFLGLSSFFADTPDVLVLRELSRLAVPLDSDEQIGTAFFVLAQTGGLSARIPQFERSLDCSNLLKGDRAKVFQKHAMFLSQTVPAQYDDEKMIRNVFKNMRDAEIKSFHMNINFTTDHPEADRIAWMAETLEGQGVSWSFSMPDRSAARSLSDKYEIVRLGSRYYAASGLK